MDNGKAEALAGGRMSDANICKVGAGQATESNDDKDKADEDPLPPNSHADPS